MYINILFYVMPLIKEMHSFKTNLRRSLIVIIQRVSRGIFRFRDQTYDTDVSEVCLLFVFQFVVIIY